MSAAGSAATGFANEATAAVSAVAAIAIDVRFVMAELQRRVDEQLPL